MLSNFSENELREIIETNMLGLMLGCKEVISIINNLMLNGEKGHKSDEKSKYRRTYI